MTDRDTTSLRRRSYLRAAGATGAAAMAGLAGCSGGGGNGNATTTADGGTQTTQDQQGWATNHPLEVLHGWTGGDGAKAINEIVQMFKENHPDMPTDFRGIGGGGNVNLNAVVLRRMANNNPPSSFANWPGENMLRYEGFLTDMERNVWEKANLKSNIKDAAQKKCVYNDGVYAAVPIGSHRLNNLFFNVHVLNQAGVDPQSLTSVSKLVDALDKIKRNTDKVPMAQAMKGPWTTLQLWVEVFLGQEGIQPYMNFVNGDPDRAAIRRSLETTKTILTNYINEDASTIGFTTANQKIINGRAGVIHQGNWVYGRYRSARDFKFQKDWGWTAFPGTKGTYVFHLDAFLAPEDNQSPEKTWEWERFVGSKPAQITFNKYKGSIPLRTDIDPSTLPEYLSLTWKDFNQAKQLPPTLTHGLAVAPETLGRVKSVIGNHFMGPFDPDAATQGLVDAVTK